MFIHVVHLLIQKKLLVSNNELNIGYLNRRHHQSCVKTFCQCNVTPD